MDDQTVTTMIEEFETAARSLQQSLLQRNVETIWSSIDLQEKAASRLDEVIRRDIESFRAVAQRNPAIRRMLDRSQALMRTNRAMASRFLDVMDRTLTQLGGGRSGGNRGYGAMSRRSSPMLVCRMG